MTIRTGRMNSGCFDANDEVELQRHQTSRTLIYSGDSMNKERGLEDGSDSESDSKDKDDSREDKNPPVCADGAAAYLQRTLGEVILGSRMNVLLIFTPFAFIANHFQWGDECTFSFALLALVPFAERVSFVTEDVAKYTNQTLGGLLNASFGNITEVVICIFALRDGLIRVVQVSMLGSVLSNLLLVLGSAFLVGGIRHKEQTFNRTAAVTNSGLLIIAVLALSLPSILDTTHEGSGQIEEVSVIRHHKVPRATNATRLLTREPLGDVGDGMGPSWLYGNGSLDTETVQGGDSPLWLSRFIAAILLGLYCLLIFFQLSTHAYIFEGENEDEEEEEPGLLGLGGGIFWLGLITFFISSLSDMIVDTIVGAAKGLGVPILFLSGILVPIVGNAAEHAAAVIFAWKNKMEICLGSAVGSAVQISLLVIPLCVMIGWGLGQPMTLNFHIFETAVLLIACIGTSFVLMDGRSHWLKGVILIASYLMIAASFWAHADPQNMS